MIPDCPVHGEDETIYRVIINALADQLYAVLRRRYKLSRPEMRNFNDRYEATMRIYYNGRQIASGNQIYDTWITVILAQPMASRLQDGCVQLQLETCVHGVVIQQHQHLFELSNPASFDQIVQWSRSMLGRYSREIVRIISQSEVVP